MHLNYNARAARAVEDSCLVGLVSRLYGKGGEVVVKLLDNFPSKAELLWIVSDHIATPLFVVSCVGQGANKAIIVFEDFQSEELAAMLVGHKLYAERSVGVGQDSDSDSDSLGDDLTQWDFLLDYEFRDLTSGCSGLVSEVYPSATNPLLGVLVGGEEVLVPFASPLIDTIDRKGRVITMRLVDEFFD
ncbi:MAG: hypothetical protein RR485_05760 [Mucinivorans sp.]